MFPQKLRLGSALELRTAWNSPYHQTPRRFIGKWALWPRIGEPGLIRQDYPPFNLSRLVLDLASEDAKNVRDYNPELDGAPDEHGVQRQQKHEALERRISQFQQECDSDQTRFQQVSRERYYDRQINDCDILSTILKERPLPHAPPSLSPDFQLSRGSMSRMTHAELAEHIWLWNGIPQFAWQHCSDAIPYMMRRRQECLRVDGKRARSSEQVKAKGGKEKKDAEPPTASALIPSIESCADLLSLKRFVQNLLWIPDGSMLVSQLSSIIARALERVFDSADSSTAQEASEFLNDVFLNLSARSLPVSVEFRAVGVLMAVRCPSLSAARSYLTADLEHTKPEEVNWYISHLAQALQILADRLETVWKGDGKLPEGLPLQQFAAETFSMLSGYDMHGHRFSESILGVMSSVNFVHCDRLLWLYTRILGELGALRTLWHTWQAMNHYESADDEPKGTEGFPSGRRSVFISAFGRTLRNVLSNRLPLEALSGERSTGIYPDDCRIDLRAILQPTRMIDEALSGLEAAAQEATAVEKPFANPLKSTSLSDPQAEKFLVKFDDLYPEGHRAGSEVVDAFREPAINDCMTKLYDMLRQATNVLEKLAPGKKRQWHGDACILTRD